jgi:hypothetical protein
MTRPGVGVAIAIIALALATTGSPGTTAQPDDFYRLRPDLRMCPSPRCGGYFVNLVNRPATLCADGAARQWCHVLEARLPRGAAPKQDRVVLVRGRIVTVRGTPVGSVERLVATRAWLPATATPAPGSVYRVVDTGIRCVRAPCFSLLAVTLNTPQRAKASDLDLTGAGATPQTSRRAQLAVSAGGLLVAGTIQREADGGRTLVATQFFLPAG